MFLKNYFGREETKSVTKELVGSILEEEITEIDLEQNPILEKNIKDEKIGILDIRAKLQYKLRCRNTIRRPKEHRKKSVILLVKNVYRKHKSRTRL